MSNGFARLFDQHLRDRGLSVRAFAQQCGVAWSFIQRVRTGRAPPPLERLEAWADLLGLVGRDRQRFRNLAYWAHVPLAIRPWLHPRLRRPIESADT